MAEDETSGSTPLEPGPAGTRAEPPHRAAANGQFGRFVVKMSFAVGAFAMAWLAYIDAPITDLSMLVLALALLCSLVAAAAGFGVEQCSEQLLNADAASIAQLQRLRLRRSRVAIAFLLAAYALAALSCGLALNLRGYGSDNGEQQAVRTTTRI